MNDTPVRSTKEVLEGLTQKDWELIGLKATVAQQAQMLDYLKAENKALRRDAERYRWLRDSPDDLDLSSADNMEEIDALIDAAMSKGEQL